jgi:hypothetical protein
MFTALFTTVKLWKQPRCPTTDKWSNKMWYLYKMEFYSAAKKNDGTGEHHIKCSYPGSESQKPHFFSLICGI